MSSPSGSQRWYFPGWTEAIDRSSYAARLRSQPGAELLDKEINRYLKGPPSAEQLAASLDQMARLMELEGQ